MAARVALGSHHIAIKRRPGQLKERRRVLDNLLCKLQPLAGFCWFLDIFDGNNMKRQPAPSCSKAGTTSDAAVAMHVRCKRPQSFDSLFSQGWMVELVLVCNHKASC